MSANDSDYKDRGPFDKIGDDVSEPPPRRPKIMFLLARSISAPSIQPLALIKIYFRILELHGDIILNYLFEKVIYRLLILITYLTQGLLISCIILHTISNTTLTSSSVYFNYVTLTIKFNNLIFVFIRRISLLTLITQIKSLLAKEERNIICSINIIFFNVSVLWISCLKFLLNIV